MRWKGVQASDWSEVRKCVLIEDDVLRRPLLKGRFYEALVW
jgi:hypothetical protein